MSSTNNYSTQALPLPPASSTQEPPNNMMQVLLHLYNYVYLPLQQVALHGDDTTLTEWTPPQVRGVVQQAVAALALDMPQLQAFAEQLYRYGQQQQQQQQMQQQQSQQHNNPSRQAYDSLYAQYEQDRSQHEQLIERYGSLRSEHSKVVKSAHSLTNQYKQLSQNHQRACHQVSQLQNQVARLEEQQVNNKDSSSSTSLNGTKKKKSRTSGGSTAMSTMKPLPRMITPSPPFAKAAATSATTTTTPTGTSSQEQHDLVVQNLKNQLQAERAQNETILASLRASSAAQKKPSLSSTQEQQQQQCHASSVSSLRIQSSHQGLRPTKTLSPQAVLTAPATMDCETNRTRGPMQGCENQDSVSQVFQLQSERDAERHENFFLRRQLFQLQNKSNSNKTLSIAAATSSSLVQDCGDNEHFDTIESLKSPRESGKLPAKKNFVWQQRVTYLEAENRRLRRVLEACQVKIQESLQEDTLFSNDHGATTDLENAMTIE